MGPQNESIPKPTLRTGAGRHRKGEILEDENVTINVQSQLRVGDTLDPIIVMSNGKHL